MRRLSSRRAFYEKRIIPFTWFGVPLLIFAAPFIQTGYVPPLSFFLGFYLIPTVVVVVVLPVGYFVMRKTVLNVVDEVLDAGDALVVKNGNQEERIALSDIVNVSYSPHMGVQRAILLLRRPSIFGTRIHFAPPTRFLFFASPIVDELIKKIDTQRGLGVR